MPHSKTFRPTLHTLEDRCVPATATLSGGVMSLTGTANADALTVRTDGNVIFWEGSSAQGGVSAGVFPLGDVRVVRVRGLGGNDRIDLSKLTLPAVALGGAGDDVILGGSGNDVLLGGAGRDVINGGGGDDWISGDAGLDVCRGGAGNDTLFDPTRLDRWFGGQGQNQVQRGGQGQSQSQGGGQQQQQSQSQSVVVIINNVVVRPA